MGDCRRGVYQKARYPNGWRASVTRTALPVCLTVFAIPEPAYSGLYLKLAEKNLYGLDGG